MPITEDFGEVPREFYSPGARENKDRDGDAIWWLHNLRDSLANSPPDTYGRGSWGFTVLRTVYTEESDTTFAIAMDGLEQRMRQYYLHMNRFPYWGERGEQRKKMDGSANEEIVHRFRIEVLQDKDKLDFPKLAGASHLTVKALVDYFNEWVMSVGGDPTEQYPANPRLCGCLVIDSEVLRLLFEMSKEEIPPLRVAIDRDEIKKWNDQTRAWVWFIDARDFGSYREGESEPKAKGWGKLNAYDIPDCWFRKAGRFDKDFWMLVEEDADEHGDFFYC